MLLRDTARIGPPPFCSATRDDALHAADAELSDGGEHRQQRQRVRSGLAGRAHELVVGRPAARARQGHGDRSALRRDPQPRRQHHPEPERGRRRRERRSPTSSSWRRRTCRANIAAGRGATFAYFGAGSGTSPLPIYLANFNGRGTAQRGRSVAVHRARTGRTRRRSTSSARSCRAATRRSRRPRRARSRATPTFRTNMLAAGLPANFWVMNPDVSSANLTQSLLDTKYDALVDRAAAPAVERPARHGQLHASRRATRLGERHAAPAAAAGADTAGVVHAFKANWTWDIPVGRGRALRLRT